jgi:hypothetical protein
VILKTILLKASSSTPPQLVVEIRALAYTQARIHVLLELSRQLYGWLRSIETNSDG